MTTTMTTTPCAFQHRAVDHHSDDRVTVNSRPTIGGPSAPVILCGKHASDEWRPVALDYLARLQVQHVPRHPSR